MVHIGSVCSRSSSLSFLLLITNCLYCVFFILPRKRNKKATLGGWCQSKCTGRQPLTKMLTLIFTNNLSSFMPFRVQYTDYISISWPEESGWNVCHNADKISSNILFPIRQPASLKSLSFSSCDCTIESISTAAPDRLNAFLAETKFVTSKRERKINCTSVCL